MKWQLSEHVMVSCEQDCDACNYCDECNNKPLTPGPAERCPCGTNLNRAKTVFSGPTGLYCSMSCVEADIEAQILSLQELLSDRDVHFEEVDTESIGLSFPSEMRKCLLDAKEELAQCGRPALECYGCEVLCSYAWGHDLKGSAMPQMPLQQAMEMGEE